MVEFVSLSLGTLCAPANKERVDDAGEVIEKLVYYQGRYRGPKEVGGGDQHLRISARNWRVSKMSMTSMGVSKKSETVTRDLRNSART